MAFTDESKWFAQFHFFPDTLEAFPQMSIEGIEGLFPFRMLVPNDNDISPIAFFFRAFVKRGVHHSPATDRPHVCPGWCDAVFTQVHAP